MRIDKAIMDCIVVNMLPYAIVEGDAFKRLNFADPAGVRRYHLKSENFSGHLLCQQRMTRLLQIKIVTTVKLYSAMGRRTEALNIIRPIPESR